MTKKKLPLISSIDERQMDKKLIKAAQEWRSTFDAVGDAICLLDNEQRILRVNRAMAEKFGMSPSEMIGKQFGEVVHGAKQPLQNCPTTHMKKSMKRESMELEIGAATFDVTVDPIFDEHGGLSGAVHILRNITQRKQIEEQLRFAQSFSQSTIDALSAHLCVLDENGVILFVNRAWREFADANSFTRGNEFIGVNYLSVCDNANGKDSEEAAAFAEGIRNVIHGNVQKFTLEYPCDSPDEERWFIGRVTRFHGDGSSNLVVVAHENITERKQAEEKLNESEKRFRALIENSSDAITLLDAKGMAIYDSPAAPGMLGYDPEDWIGQEVFALIHPDDLPRIRGIFQNLVETPGVHVNSTFRLQHKNGSWLWIEMAATNLLAEPSVKAIVLNYRDITERVQADNALRKSEELYRSLFDRMMDGIYRSTHEGKFVDVNPAMVKMFGYSSKEEMLNVDIRNELYFAPDERGSHVLDTGLEEMDVYRMRRKDGSAIWVEDHGFYVHDEQGRIVYHEGMLRDITGRKLAEEALRGSEEKYRRLFENASLGIFQSTPDGKAISVNLAFAHMFGYDSPEDALNNIKNVGTDIFADPNRRTEILRLMVENPDLRTFENLYRRKDGSTFIGNLNSMPIMDANGSLNRMEGIIEDISGRKQAEAALQVAKEYAENLVQTANTIVVGLDLHGNITVYNKAAETITGYTRSDLQGRNWFEVVVPKNRYPHTWAEFEKLTTDGIVKNFENPILTKTGKERTIAWQNNEVLENGKVVGTISFGMDITERKQAEEKVIASETRYRRLFEAAKDGILILDAETGIIIDVNPFLSEMLDISHEEIIGKELWELGFFKDIAENKANFLELQQKEYIRYDDLPLETANGRKFNVEFVSNVYHVNHHKVVQCNIRDITERKHVEEALKASEQRLGIILENIHEAVWSADLSGQYDYLSPIMETIYGRPIAEMKANPNFWLEAAHPDDQGRVRASSENLLRDGRVEIEHRCICPDGRACWILDRKILIRDENGKPLRIAGVVSDITERKQAEKELLESEEKFRIAQDMSPDGFTILRPVRDAQERVVDFTWIYENAAVARLNGTDPEAVVGRRLLELFPDHRGTQFLRAYQQVAESGETCIFESGYSSESMIKPTSFRIVVVPMGGDIAILAQDITKRVQAEDEIKKQLDELQRWHNATLGREMRVLELKREVNELLGKAGQPPCYPSAE